MAKGAAVVAALLAGAIVCNVGYQLLHKPTELFFPVSGLFAKTPAQTWARYGKAFRDNATPVVTAGFLAALAQTESSGNPVVRTYWRWAWVPRPFDIYRPASSSVGMYQMTDGTFAQARHWCIRRHAAVREGGSGDASCGVDTPYYRVLPSDATELTAAYLDRSVAATLRRHGLEHASLRQKQHLAAVIHLCGPGEGERYATQGFRIEGEPRCGEHDPRRYLSRIDALQTVFDRLARAG